MKLHIIRRDNLNGRTQKTGALQRVPRAFLQNWAMGVVRELQKNGLRDARLKLDVNLVFVTAGEMRRLNLEFRGKNYATDVLSFGSSEPDSLGELVLCIPVLKRQARDHQLSFQEELGYMVLHGILHLLGYDHERSKKEERAMFELQDAVFERLLRK